MAAGARGADGRWLQRLIAMGLSLGIGKRELMEDYYLDEIGAVAEAWNALRRPPAEDAEEAVTPEDLIPYPLILPSGSITNSRIEKWFGDYAGEIKLAATGNLLYNQAMMAESGIGISVGIKLECEYKNLCFVPLSPALEYGTVLAWKKEQVFSSATTAFIEHVKEYVKEYAKGIDDDER